MFGSSSLSFLSDKEDVGLLLLAGLGNRNRKEFVLLIPIRT